VETAGRRFSGQTDRQRTEARHVRDGFPALISSQGAVFDDTDVRKTCKRPVKRQPIRSRPGKLKTLFAGFGFILLMPG
jgi:hypothetical protein